MRFVSERQKLVNRRSIVLAGLLGLSVPVLVGRLYYLQRVAGQKYRKLAEKNRIHLRLMQPPRGRLFDAKKRILAHDVLTPRLVLIREQTPNVQKTLAKVAQILPLGPKTRARIMQESARQPKFMPVTIKRTLPFAQLARIQVNLPDLPGVDFTQVPLRRYAGDKTFGHLLGYVGLSHDEKVTKSEDWSPDFPVGRGGLEQLYENELRGEAGYRHVEVNAHGREVREVERFVPATGKDIHLTLNLAVQQTAWEALGDHVGAAVVLDVTNGAVIAAASKPSFNPNSFTEGLNREAWQSLLQNPGKPLINRPLQGLYAPGSTVKPVVALAALAEGEASWDEKITCRGKVHFGDRDFHCWKRHGTLDLSGAIRESCDIYFYELGKRLGMNKLAEYYRQFGLGSPSSIGLDEKNGIVPDPQWKAKHVGERWSEGETLIAAIGQGYMLTTPLQLAVFSARLATGKQVVPFIRQDRLMSDFKPIDVNLKLRKQTLQAMRDVVHHPRGTAKRARAKGYETAGKTGTAQVISKRFEDMETHEIAYRERPHALFIAFAPFENPKYAVAVVVEHGASGGREAAPVAQKVLAKAMEENT